MPPIVRTYSKEDIRELRELAPPDGGTWSWVVLGGSMVINMLIPGFVKSFGLFFNDIRYNFNATPAQITWIPSITFFMYNFMGPAAGMISKRFSCRVTATLGGLLASAGLIGSYFAPSVYVLYVTYGALVGSGACFSYTSGLLIIGSYFEKRLGLANGLSVSGSAFGAIIFPPILDWMLSEYGLKPTWLLSGAVMLHVVSCAGLYQPVEWHMKNVKRPARVTEDHPEGGRRHASLTDADSSSHRRNSAETVESAASLYYLSTMLNGSSPAVCQREESIHILESAKRKRAASNECATTADSQPPPPRNKIKLIDVTLLWNPVFLILLTAGSLFQIAITNVIILLPAYAMNVGFTRQQASLLLSVMAGADLVGRIGGAGLSDLHLIPRQYFIIGAYVLSFVALLTTPVAACCGGYFTLAGTSGLIGLCTGVVAGLYSVILIEYLGLDRLASTYGLSLCLSGMCLLGGPPLFGKVLEATNDYDVVIYALCTLPLFAAFFWGAMPWARHFIKRKRRHSVREATTDSQNIM